MTHHANRWRPRRAGIVNLYEYSDQVFDFAGGRLLLRGHNTSGKTKALELLLPFCLDGDIRPSKLDPFASGSKDMKWNLVGSGDSEQRVGYVWLEFERLDAAGATHRLTAGIGLRAHKALPTVTRWYFVARGRSVGTDLALLRGRDPISRADLAAALGDDGEVLDSQRDYRARLNDLLFGFTGEEQYQTMLRLMLDLRRPHLSKTLNPDGVAAQLSAGLPEVDDGLMRRLAGGLEQLETLERGLARLRAVREQVRRFHQRTYSAYARAVVRERAEALRRSQTAVEAAAERLRETRAALDGERAREAAATVDREAAEAAVTRLAAEERALVGSAAWSSVAEVEALRGQAAAQRNAAGAAGEHAELAAANASGLEAELITARAAAGAQREQADADLSLAVALAERAGLARRAGLLTTQLREASMTPQTWASLLRDLTFDWRDVLHRHRELMADAQSAGEAAERARATEREASARLGELSDRRVACEEQLEAAQDALGDRLLAWRSALVELEVDYEAAAAALSLVSAGQSPAAAFAPAADRARGRLADARASVAAARGAALEARARAEAEVERLAASHDDGPSAPPWERAQRSGREGAPLWRLVEFGAAVPDGRRAALEGALEAMGLLDAWVTPSGRVEDPQTADVVLTTGTPAHGPTLEAVLEPVAGQPVAGSVVADLLAGIGLGERSAGPWVDLDGRFVLGPLSGRGAKAEAEHIGAVAREARRARRIAELEALVAELEAAIAVHDDGLTVVDRRRAALEAELGALPPVDAVASASDALRIATARAADGGRVHERALAESRAAGAAEVAADAARREHAVDHELAPKVDERALGGLRDAAVELAGVAGTVARAWVLAAREVEASAALGERLAEAHDVAEERAGRARDEQAEAARLTAEHAAREQALGASGEELRRRYGDVQSELRVGREALRRAAETAQAAAIGAARLEQDTTARAGEHEHAHRLREAAGREFAEVRVAGLLALVLGDAAPDEVRGSGGWSITRMLEITRTLPEALVAVRSASGPLAVEVQSNVRLLDRELADADMGAYASRGEDGLLLVHVTEASGEQPLAQVLDALGAEIADRERVLTTEERRVFSDALVEEIADHLRQRIHEVRGRIEHMNAVLRRSPTAAGKTVELDWQPLEDDSGTQRAALALLRRDVRHLGEDGRPGLVAFFRQRVEAARREHAFGGDPQPMADTLSVAFDYRRWFAFGLHERTEAGRTRLTRKRHAVGSGGEQSVLIHLPLFAAAAALYGDSPAPRLIMLDEALSGIDDGTRERVLEATVAFDLDVVMTSHELWGTYRSVPQLAIYQLHRENGVFGVHAIPFVWDGNVLHEREPDQLLA